MKKYYIRSISASKKVIPLSMPLFNWLIKFMNHLETAITNLGCLLIYLWPVTLLSSSKILNPIMFEGDTNLLYEHKNIIKLFATVNEELMNINDWFMANKLSECWENEIFIIPYT